MKKYLISILILGNVAGFAYRRDYISDINAYRPASYNYEIVSSVTGKVTDYCILRTGERPPLDNLIVNEKFIKIDDIVLDKEDLQRLVKLLRKTL
jgi:hypothetical protein